MSWSLAVIVHAVEPSASSPFGEFALAAASAARTWPRPIPSCASTLGSTRARTAGRAPPPMVTCPTPATWESFWARTESAASNRRPTGSVSDVRARIRIGASAGLIFR